LLKVTLNTKINQSINQSKLIFIGIKLMMWRHTDQYFQYQSQSVGTDNITQQDQRENVYLLRYDVEWNSFSQ
jgi:hypothetical protein